MAVAVMTKTFGRGRSVRPVLEIAPFAVFSGIVFTVPYYIAALFLGPELPSIIGGIVGLLILVTAVRRRFLLPKKIWKFPDAGEWDKSWLAAINSSSEGREKMPLLLAWAPYILIALLLVITRLPFLGIRAILSTRGVDIPIGFGIDKMYTLKWAYLPGIFPFMFIALITHLIHGMSLKQVKKAWVSSFKQISGAALALFAGFAMVQLMIHSHLNNSGLPSMITVMAETMARTAGSMYVFVSPFIGVLGAFISGSNTVSNILFSSLQFETAALLKLPELLIITLQVVGGGIGNMICINNIVAVSATVGIVGMGGRIIRKNAVPMVIYSIAVGLFIFILMAAGVRPL